MLYVIWPTSNNLPLDWITSSLGSSEGWYGTPQVPKLRKVFAKMKRSRAGDDPRYPKLCSSPKTKKVVVV